MSLIQMSIAGGAIILAATVIRAVALNRLPKQAFMALWAVAVARLSLPFSVPARWSVYSLFTQSTPALPRTDVIVRSVPTAAATMPPTPQVDIIENTVSVTATATLSPWVVLWAVVGCALALAFVLSYVKCRRAFQGSLPVEDDYIHTRLAGQALCRTVAVRLSEAVSTPLTYGVARPVILLPASMDLSDRETLGYVLDHELAHIRMFHALWKPVLAAVACLHWFNPLVWVMFLLAGRDMELAADEAVLRRTGADVRHGYARALLAMEERRAGFAAASFFSKNAIEERIVSIMKIKPHSLLSIILAAALVISTAALFATSASAAEDKKVDITKSPYEISDEDAAMTELALRRLKEKYPDVAAWIRSTYPDVVWWTQEGYQAMMEENLEELEGLTGQVIGSNSSGDILVTQEMIELNRELYESTLADIQNGWLVSKAMGGDEDLGVLCINPADIALGIDERALQCSIRLLDGTVVDFGPYGTAGDMLVNIAPFLLEQMKAGNLDLSEAREIAARYEMQTEGITRGTSYDGTTYVQWDDSGYIEISEEDFDLLFPRPEIVWWTAEEYAAWLEEEKLALQEVIGSQAWTSTDGWFTWTQEKVEQTIAMYEQILIAIENGALISKTVDGSSDVMLASGWPAFGTVISAEEDAVTTASDEIELATSIAAEEAALQQELEDAILADRQASWAETLEPAEKMAAD